jgi:hypothetical protein
MHMELKIKTGISKGINALLVYLIFILFPAVNGWANINVWAKINVWADAVLAQSF